MFRLNLRARFVSRVVVFTSIGHRRRAGNKLSTEVLRILVFLVRKVWMDPTNKASNFW